MITAEEARTLTREKVGPIWSDELMLSYALIESMANRGGRFIYIRLVSVDSDAVIRALEDLGFSVKKDPDPTWYRVSW
jgi:hypothetical protein